MTAVTVLARPPACPVEALDRDPAGWSQAAREVRRDAGTYARSCWQMGTGPLGALGRWRAAIVVVWVLGLLGDLLTTVVGLHSGHVEANPVAAAGMDAVGALPFMLAATVLGGVCCLASIGKVTSSNQIPLVAGAWLLGAGKLAVAAYNFVLLAG